MKTQHLLVQGMLRPAIGLPLCLSTMTSDAVCTVTNAKLVVLLPSNAGTTVLPDRDQQVQDRLSHLQGVLLLGCDVHVLHVLIVIQVALQHLTHLFTQQDVDTTGC